MEAKLNPDGTIKPQALDDAAAPSTDDPPQIQGFIWMGPRRLQARLEMLV